ncbi:MAG: hypothetical protein JWO39_2362 [Gemmatimonadetes bacterium]|nr:hypothetical protein [Gemmatimonadota bacterium]
MNTGSECAKPSRLRSSERAPLLRPCKLCATACGAWSVIRNESATARRWNGRDVLFLVFVLAQLCGANGILAELPSYHIHGARHRSVALRLE